MAKEKEIDASLIGTSNNQMATNNYNVPNNDLNVNSMQPMQNNSNINEGQSVNSFNNPMEQSMQSNINNIPIDNNMGNNLNEVVQNPNMEQSFNETESSNAISGFNNNQYKPIENGKKIRFNYQILTPQGQKVKGNIDAYTRDEVVNFLLNDGNKIIKLNPARGPKILTMSIGGDKLKYSELAFILTQLSTYLKAGIPLIDSVKILEKQSVKREQKRIFGNIVLELTKGESFSNALDAQGNTFPKLLINMVKTAEMTGDLPSILDDMTDYYTTIDRTRKQAISAMTYPILIFIFSLMVITFILVYIIPEFVGLFEQNRATIPALTKFVINTSNFLTENILLVVLVLLGFILIYSMCFKYIKPFRKMMQSLFMKLPIIGNIMIYKEVAMFTKTFASLLNHNVFITDSMAILSTITTNEVYAEIINDSLAYLSRGAKISDSFKGKWAFPIVAYEMLVTGENTGRLPMMMDYVAKYYDDLHANYVKRINTFIEPVMIIFLALIVGVVVLSVIIPMFSFYSQIA